MSMISNVFIDYIDSFVEIKDESCLKEIEDICRYRMNGYQFTPSYKEGRWDGWISLSRRIKGGLRVPTGLVPHILELFFKLGIDVVINNNRVRPEPDIEMFDGKLGGVVLRDYQLDMVSSVLDGVYQDEKPAILSLTPEETNHLYLNIGMKSRYRLPGWGIWSAATGCHSLGTLVVLYNGKTIPVEQVKVNDLLMGADGSSREVLNIIRGEGIMHRVIPRKGKSFIVNTDHVLTLIHNVSGKIIDVSVAEWLCWSKSEKKVYKLFRIDIEGKKKEGKLQKKDILKTSFKIEQMGIDQFCGFSLSGDGRYLMGDFTVTHNSGKTESAAALIGSLGVKTLFVVYGNTLVKQTYNRFKQRLGDWLKKYNRYLGIGIEGKIDPGFVTVSGSSTLITILRRPEDVVKKVKKTLVNLMNTRERRDKKIFDSGFFSDEILGPFYRWVSSYAKAVNKNKVNDVLAVIEQFKNLYRDDDLYNACLSSMKILFGYPKKLNEAVDKKKKLLKFLESIKLLIVDEVHGAAAEEFYDLLRKCPAYYRIGCSGTPLSRSDGQNLRIIAALGDPIVNISNADMRDAGVAPPAKIIFSKIGGTVEFVERVGWDEIYNAGIVNYMPRNYKIIYLVQKYYEQGKRILVVFRVREHGELLSDLLWCERTMDLEDTFIPSEVIHETPIPNERVDGRDSVPRREEVISKIRSGIVRVVFASGIFDTGVDIPEIDVLINAAAGEGVIPVKQRLGRSLRGTEPVIIHDFADGQHRILAEHSLNRYKIYNNEKCFQIVVE